MGYCITNTDSSVSIKRVNITAALAAIKAMYEPVGDREPRFSWIDSETVLKAETLEAALSEWRWDVTEDGEGNITCLTFSGDKLGDDEDLFYNLAPFIEHGGYIEIRGEDDNPWRWVFWRGELRTEYPVIIWPYETVTPAMELAEVIGEELAETA